MLGFVVIVLGIWVGFDGDEVIVVIVIGKYFVKVGEVWVQWCIVLVFFVEVVVGGIVLLDFQQGIVYWFVVFIEYVVGDDDFFVQWFVFVLCGQVYVVWQDQFG